MASMQCQKPVHQTGVVPQKKSQDHSFADKVKEMAHSAGKLFEHKNHPQNNGQNCHQQPHAQQGLVKNHAAVSHESHAKNHSSQQSAGCFPGKTHHATKTHEKREGHGGNFLSNIGEHVKNMTSKKNKTNRAGNHSDSSSSDESDNETCEKKN